MNARLNSNTPGTDGDAAAAPPLSGKLLEHGAGTAAIGGEQSPSYYVTFLDNKDERQTVWGPELEGAVQASGALAGERIELSSRAAAVGAGWDVRKLAGAPPTASASDAHPALRSDAATADALRMAVSQIIGERAPGAPAIADAAPGNAAPQPSSAAASVSQAAHHSAELGAPALPARERTPTQQAGAAAEVVSFAGLPAVLPRLSEYRIAQVGKSAAAFEQGQENFWQASPRLAALRTEMERLAREQGVPMQDIVDKMKPGGDLAELRVKFNEAVAEAPEAGPYKKAMDKALDSYTRQYGRAQEEMLNPDLHNNPHYDALKSRLATSHENMVEQAGQMPAFGADKGGLEPSHGQKLTQSVDTIMTRIEQVSEELQSMLRARRGDDHEAPGP